jgi:hypothetical protein
MALFMKKSQASRHMILAGLAILALGAGTATAAISLGPDPAINPAAHPLALARGVSVQSAFGVDDEDCVYATHKVVLPSGRLQAVRSLHCVE